MANNLVELKKPQEVMESRYVLPYNWARLPSSRHWRQKNGIWNIASRLAGDLNGKHVLDAGCGDGWYSARMEQSRAIVEGCDYSEKAIAFADIIISNASFKVGSILDLPYEDSSFDVVFSFQVLEHLEPGDLAQAIKEVSRVLKPNGLFIPSVPTKRRPMSTAHFQHFTKESITESLGDFFDVEELVGQECYDWSLKFIERILENRWWFLPGVAESFNKGWYLSRWNEGTAEKGHNFVIKSRNKK